MRRFASRWVEVQVYWVLVRLDPEDLNLSTSPDKVITRAHTSIQKDLIRLSKQYICVSPSPLTIENWDPETAHFWLSEGFEFFTKNDSRRFEGDVKKYLSQKGLLRTLRKGIETYEDEDIVDLDSARLPLEVRKKLEKKLEKKYKKNLPTHSEVWSVVLAVEYRGATGEAMAENLLDDFERLCQSYGGESGGWGGGSADEQVDYLFKENMKGAKSVFSELQQLVKSYKRLSGVVLLTKWFEDDEDSYEEVDEYRF